MYQDIFDQIPVSVFGIPGPVPQESKRTAIPRIAGCKKEAKPPWGIVGGSRKTQNPRPYPYFTQANDIGEEIFFSRRLAKRACSVCEVFSNQLSYGGCNCPHWVIPIDYETSIESQQRQHKSNKSCLFYGKIKSNTGRFIPENPKDDKVILSRWMIVTSKCE